MGKHVDQMYKGVVDFVAIFDRKISGLLRPHFMGTLSHTKSRQQAGRKTKGIARTPRPTGAAMASFITSEYPDQPAVAAW